MKKQFKFAVAIKNYDQETIDFCKELGYEVNSLADNNFYYKYLINDHFRVNGAVTNIHYTSGQTLCNWKTEKELCKALLAATEGNNIYGLEYYFMPNSYEMKRNTMNCAANYVGCGIYKKPTLTQLLTHFRNKRICDLPPITNQIDKDLLKSFGENENKIKVGTHILNPLKDKPMEKKIIGYKAKTDWRKIAIARLMQLDLMAFNGSFNLDKDKYIVDNLTQLQVLDLWCEPIYEEDKLFLDYEKTIEVVKGKGYVQIDKTILDLNDIQQMICISNRKYMEVYLHNHKVSFEKLEKIKEMLNK